MIFHGCGAAMVVGPKWRADRAEFEIVEFVSSRVRRLLQPIRIYPDRSTTSTH
jgi:hypothetical protein